jgi:chemotaxis protein histidine kinase CheA
MIKVEVKGSTKEKTMNAPKEKVEKSLFPLPYNGELKEECCYALRQNNGLYTQCTGIRREDGKFCKGCASAMQKTGAETPEYGTIQDRMAVGIFEYVDPKGRKPTSYTKVMKKYKINEEQVLAEAEKLGIVVNKMHFEVSEETKRGRPKVEKEPKEKGAKGRPKKAKKVVDIEGDDEDLFATLLANAAEKEEVLKKDEEKNAEKEDELILKEKESKKEVKKKATEEEKAAKKKAAEEEKAAKKKAAEEEKAAKKKAAEEEKAAKKKAAEEEKEAKKKAAEEEKEAKKKAAEEKKAAKKKSEEETKSEKSDKPKDEEVEEDEEPDVVKKIEFEGKKYLKSKKTGIIYDYISYVKEGDQLVVGKWNDATNKIDWRLSCYSSSFKDEDEEEEDDEEEEEEEEYDM